MIGTVLAKGRDRWEPDGADFRLKQEGDLWMMVWPWLDGPNPSLGPYIILKPEVADWCFENIGAYRIVERIPSGRCGPEEDDCWWIEFQSATDGVFFKSRWW
jgi:hypothetical protein